MTSASSVDLPPGGGMAGEEASGRQRRGLRRAAARARQRLLGEPLLRNGHALNLSTAASSVAGLVFWLVAAHRYGAATVGRNAAAISALMFLGGVAQLNLSSALVRFLPTAGPRARRLLFAVYATAAAVAILLSSAFLAVVGRLVPELGFLVHSRAMAAWFVASSAVWAIFVLEDGALTGLRRAGWVPVENAGFGLAKLVAVAALAAPLPGTGVLVAWTACTALTVVPTNVLILLKAVGPAAAGAPAGAPASGAPAEGSSMLAQLLRYVPYDFAGSLCWLAATSLVPVLVIARVGASRGAVLNLCWVIAYAMYLASINLGSSLVVETASGRSSLAAARRSARSHLLVLLAPGAAVVALLARPLLGLFGPAYAGSGPLLLALLAISSLPFVAVATAVSSYRSLSATRNVAVINAALLAVLAAVTFPLVAPLGPLALGVGWLVAQCVVAAGIAVRERSERRLAWPAVGELSLVAARLAARWPLPGPLRRIGSRQADAASRRLIEDVLPDVRSFLRGVATGARSGGGVGLDLVAWTRELSPGDVTVCPGGSDRTVAQISLDGCRDRLLVKVARSEAGAEELRREHAVLARLHAEERLGEWRKLLPHWEAGDELRPDCVVERVLPGVDASRLLRKRPELADRVAHAGLEAVGILHRRTAERALVDAGRLASWLSAPLELLRTSHPTGRVPETQVIAIAALERRLREALEGRTLELSWVHGDFTPGNVLVEDTYATVSGIVDWSRARPGVPPALDRLLWLAAIHCEVTGQQLGALVEDLLVSGSGVLRLRAVGGAAGELWRSLPADPDDRPRPGAASRHPAGALPVTELLLWAWLDHVTSNLAKSARYLGSPMWWVANVEPVLAALARWKPAPETAPAERPRLSPQPVAAHPATVSGSAAAGPAAAGVPLAGGAAMPGGAVDAAVAPCPEMAPCTRPDLVEVNRGRRDHAPE